MHAIDIHCLSRTDRVFLGLTPLDTSFVESLLPRTARGAKGELGEKVCQKTEVTS